MNNARIRSQQLAKFEAKLNTIQSQSFKFTDTNLRDLAAKRDAYLASLRWYIVKKVHPLFNTNHVSQQYYRRLQISVLMW